MRARPEPPLPSATRPAATPAHRGPAAMRSKCSRAASGDQARRGGTRLGGDVAAGQHAGDLLLSRILIEFLDAGHGIAGGEALCDAPMISPARRDLRRMGDDENLQAGAEALQPLADCRGYGATDAAVDLVEDQGRHR